MRRIKLHLISKDLITMTSRRLLASLWAVRGSNAVSHGSCISSSQIPRHIHTQGTIVREDSEQKESGSWMPEWMRARMPGVLGGSREEIQEMQDLTLDSYASQLKMARRLGSMSGSAFGSTSASDPAAQGTLLLYEKIIERMDSEEREDVNALTLNRKAVVAEQVGCSVEQVEDCIARFKWTQHMMRTLAAYRKKGNPMPKTMEELEQVVGKWQSFRSSEAGLASSGVASSGSIVIAMDAVSPKDGKPCGLAGMTVGRSTKCPRFRKSYKACCGKYTR